MSSETARFHQITVGPAKAGETYSVGEILCFDGNGVVVLGNDVAGLTYAGVGIRVPWPSSPPEIDQYTILDNTDGPDGVWEPVGDGSRPSPQASFDRAFPITLKFSGTEPKAGDKAFVVKGAATVDATVNSIEIPGVVLEKKKNGFWTVG